MRELLNRVWKKEEGFSLIELIIVIAILAIIAAIAVPNLLGNIDKANKSTDESNAKLIADAVATAVATNPLLVGVPVGADAANSEEFISGADTTLDAAIVVLNDTIPKIKSNDYGVPGDEFFVHMTSEGVISVYGTGSVTGTVDTTIKLFPID